MYEFRDTISSDDSPVILPAEALSVNGQYLETLISGYRTLNVSGRESPEMTITSKDFSALPGARFISRRDPVRTLEVRFALFSVSDQAYRKVFNQLIAFLHQEKPDGSLDALRLVFHDEEDKYFLGYFESCDVSSAGLNTVTGTLRFKCLDPYKYAVEEQAVPFFARSEDASGKRGRQAEAVLKNSGAGSVALRTEVFPGKETGYIGLVSAHGAVEVGHIQEADMDPNTQEARQTLSMENFIQAKGAASDGVRLEKKTKRDEKNVLRTYLFPDGVLNAFPTGPAWSTGRRSVALPTTCANAKAAQMSRWNKDWEISSFHWFEGGGWGRQTISVYGTVPGRTGECELAFYSIFKNTDDTKAYIEFRIDGKLQGNLIAIENGSVPANNYAGGKHGYGGFSKQGAVFTFNGNGTNHKFTYAAFKDATAVRVEVSFQVYYGHAWTPQNAIADIAYRTYLVGKDVKNSIPAAKNSPLIIDGERGKIFLEGKERPDLEVIGSKYFEIPPGETKIRIVPSSWFTGTLSGTIYYREKWL